MEIATNLFLDDFYVDKKISLFLRLHPLGFPHPKQRQTTRKYTSFTTQFGSTHTRRSADFKKNLFFWRFRRFRGGSSLTRLQRTKRRRNRPNTPKPPKKLTSGMELRVARGSCRAKAPCRRVPLLSDPVGARQLCAKALRRCMPDTLLQEMTSKDKASCGSSPPCSDSLD